MKRAASLFCGAGGTCLGLRQAGYEVVAGFDMNTDALATYEAAGGHPIRHMITVEEPIPALSAVVALMADLDLLWASPPCQPWSQAGKRKGAADERDAWPATIAAVRLLRPRWFIAENVRGVEDHYRSFVTPALEAMGYVVSWRVLDAANYGLPQRRHRVILVAGPEPYPWPHPTHGKRSLFVRQGWKSMGEALGIEVRAIGQINPDTARGGNRWRESSETDPTIPAIASGITAEVVDPSWFDSPSPAVCASEAKGHTNPHLDRGRASPINRASDANFLATGRRRLTTEECAILQGFPSDYPWQGGITSRYRQIGNAVPPLLARVLAERIPC